MRKRWPLLTCALIGVFGVVVIRAEIPPDEYSKAMKGINVSMQNVTKAIQADDFDAVSMNAGAIVDAFPVVEKYWTGKSEDAVMLAQTAAKAAGDLRAVAALKSGDGVAYAAKQLTDACAQCHAAHREMLPDGTFEIK